MKHQPQRLIHDTAPETAGVARLLAHVEIGEPSQDDRDRIWRALSSSMHAPAPRRRWLVAFSLGATAVAAALIVSNVSNRQTVSAPESPPEHSFAVSFVSGDASTASSDSPWIPVRVHARLSAGSRIRTGMHSRTHLYRVDAGLLLTERTEVALLHPFEVALSDGALVSHVACADAGRFSVHARSYWIRAATASFSVRVRRFVEVHVISGTAELETPTDHPVQITAGHCWSSLTGAVSVCSDEIADRALSDALREHPAIGALLRIEGDEQLAVEVSGLAAGRPPIQWWLQPGPYTISGRSGDRQLTGQVTLTADTETVFDFAQLAGKQTPPEPAHDDDSAARPRKKAAAIPPHAKTKAKSVHPVATPRRGDPPGVARLRKRLAAATSPALREEILYELGVLLTRLRLYHQAVSIFDELSRTARRHRALALYELGRIKYRYLGDPEGARVALRAYQRKYPAGALRQEVDLTIIEALLAKGARRSAHTAMDHFLSSHATSERRSEVLVLRGNVLRESGKCSVARRDYARVMRAKSTGPLADDAMYFAAVCDTKLGNTKRARALLSRYLSRFPSGRHLASVKQALGSTAGRE